MCLVVCVCVGILCLLCRDYCVCLFGSFMRGGDVYLSDSVFPSCGLVVVDFLGGSLM